MRVLSPAMNHSLHKSIHPPEMETTLKDGGEWLPVWWGHKKNGHAGNPLTLQNAFITVQLYILGDPPTVFSCGMLQQLHLPGSHNCLHITVPILPHFHLPLLIRSSRPEFPVAQYPCVSIPATIRSSHNHRSKHSATIAQYLRASIPPPIRSSYKHSNHSATIPQYPCLHTTNDQEQL